MRLHTEIRASDLFAMALVLGVASGLFEGAVHLVLQRFMLENVWYQIIWIAAVFNGLVVSALAAVWSGALRLPAVRARGGDALVFSLVLAAWLPCIALMLKAWIHPAAILLLAVGTTMAVTRAIRRRERRVFDFCRRSVPFAVGALLLAIVGIEGGLALRERFLTWRLPPARAGSPDVLLLIVDTLRADHLSSYGYTGSLTPNIDRLGAEGVRFARAFSTSSWTLPAHLSMLTGLYPAEHRVEWLTSKDWSRTSFRILPEILQESGYRTAAFSGNTYWVTREHGFGRGFLHFEDYFHSPLDMVLRTAYGRIVARLVLPRLGFRDIPGRKRAEDTNRALLAWMARDPDRPAFVMVNYFDAHDPYWPPAEYARGHEPRGVINSLFGTPDTLAPDEVRGEIASYDGSIRYVDAQIGRLLSALEQRRSRDLLVVLTSDHGEEFGEHGAYGHGNSLYRETVHVPLVFWQPGRIPRGAQVETPVSVASIPATIIEMLEVRTALGTVPSLRVLWDGAPEDWPEPLLELAQRPWHDDDTLIRHGSMRSLVRSGWHLIEHTAFGTELYDHGSDPAERRNLARDPDHQLLVTELRSRLHDAHRGGTDRHEKTPAGAAER